MKEFNLGAQCTAVGCFGILEHIVKFWGSPHVQQLAPTVAVCALTVCIINEVPRQLHI